MTYRTYNFSELGSGLVMLIYIYIYLCINFKICLFDGDLIAWILRYGHGVRNVSDSDGFQIWDWGVTNPPNIVGIPVETDRLGNFFWTLIFLLVLSREWMGMGEWDDYY